MSVNNGVYVHGDSRSDGCAQRDPIRDRSPADKNEVFDQFFEQFASGVKQVIAHGAAST
jgi:hypothetical protein